MWDELDLFGLAQIGLGAIVGAALAIAVERTQPGRSAFVAFNVAVCTTAGIVTMISMRWPHVPVWFGVGLVSTAAPITLAIVPTRSITTASDARRYLRRIAATVTIHVAYGVTFALVGFIVALGLVLTIAAAT
ncbi:MAG: hypothetical protein QOF31_3677 [Mycobacterium sp.]|nr:hypothetical protein [Mycobacterium sp.]